MHISEYVTKAAYFAENVYKEDMILVFGFEGMTFKSRFDRKGKRKVFPKRDEV